MKTYPIPGCPNYEADRRGNIYSRIQYGQYKEPLRKLALFQDGAGGYPRVRLTVNKRRRHRNVHSLIAATFHGPKPINGQVRHLNGKKQDNRACNLKWGTPADNGRDKVRLGESSKGEKNGASRLTTIQVHNIKKLLSGLKGTRIIAAAVGVDQATIRRIKNRKAWTHV
jgi:hypothetical protein